MKMHIETQPGYGTEQGIISRFYLQFDELCKFLNSGPSTDKIPSIFLEKIIPELANLYDLQRKIRTNIEDFSKGVREGVLFKVDIDGSTTFSRSKEFDIDNLVKDFFVRSKILLVLFFKCGALVDGDFKIEEFYFCDEAKFDRKFLQIQSGIQSKYLPVLYVLKKARLTFLDELKNIRGEIEHENFRLERFKVFYNASIIELIEPNLKGYKLSERISFYYEKTLELIEKLTVYFIGINCEEKNKFFQLYVAVNPDFSNLIYRYHYRIMGMPFAFETVRCEYN